MGEWGPIYGLFGIFLTVIGGFAGTVYVTRAKAKQDEPFELLKQYKVMVDTLRDDLKSARADLVAARAEAHQLREEVKQARKEVHEARAELTAAKEELDIYRAAAGVTPLALPR